MLYASTLKEFSLNVVFTLITTDSFFNSLEEKEEGEMRFVDNVKFHCVNFPPNGPVMQRRILGWEPSTENMYPRNGFLEGYDEKTFRLEGGGYYQAEHKSIYK